MKSKPHPIPLLIGEGAMFPLLIGEGSPCSFRFIPSFVEGFVRVKRLTLKGNRGVRTI